MKRIRIAKRRHPRKSWPEPEPLDPLDPRDPEIARAKELARDTRPRSRRAA
jgi:hypothetical protein